ncbi:MAG: TraB/GumN family protein [Nanoarchaeota archaeon]
MLERLHIIGTSHIAAESVEKIGAFLESHEIDLVCVELDKERLVALQNNVQQRIRPTNLSMLRQVGLTGFIFALIASVTQRKLGEQVKTKAGSDMMAAVRHAAKRQIPVALIDQKVAVTLKNLSKNVTFKEKMRLVWDLLKGLVGLDSALTEISLNDIDLKKVPSDAVIEKVLKKTKHRYAGLYDVLVASRNRYMAKRILTLLSNHPDWNILVVIGAGHKEGLVEMLEHKAGEQVKYK